jgi:hypothetical protein
VHHFGVIPNLGLLSNILAIPFFTIFIMPIGFLAVIFSYIPYLNILLWKTLFYLIKLFTETTVVISNYTHLWYFTNFNGYLLVIFFIGLLVYILFKSKELKVIGIILIIISIVMYLLFPIPQTIITHKMIIHQENNKAQIIQIQKDDFMQEIILQEIGKKTYTKNNCLNKNQYCILAKTILIIQNLPQDRTCTLIRNNHFLYVIDYTKKNTVKPECISQKTNYISLSTIYKKGTIIIQKST